MYSLVLNKCAVRLLIFEKFSYLQALIIGAYTFITFHEISYLHKLYIDLKGRFQFVVLGHSNVSRYYRKKFRNDIFTAEADSRFCWVSKDQKFHAKNEFCGL